MPTALFALFTAKIAAPLTADGYASVGSKVVTPSGLKTRWCYR